MKLIIKNIETLNNINSCPNCSSKSKIIDCRMDRTNTIKIRLHKCEKCGKTWDTAEIMSEDLSYLLEAENSASNRKLSNVSKCLSSLANNIESYNKLIYEQKISIEHMNRRFSELFEDVCEEEIK